MTALFRGEGDGGNYRARLGQALPAILLAYLVLIWPLIYARGVVTADLATGPMPEDQSFLLNRLFFPVLAGIAILILVAERHRLARFSLAGFFLVIGLFGWLCLSTLWALAPSVTVSKILLFAMQGIALLVAVLTARRLEDVVRPLFWVMVVTLLINALAIPIIPRTAIGYAGIYSHKNTLGGISVLCGLFALYGATRGDRVTRWTGIAMIPVALLLLYLSESKTSLGLFLLAPLLAAAGLFARRYLRLALVVLIVVFAFPAAVLMSGAVPGISYHTVSRVISGDGTFTGRTLVWAFATEEVAKRPLTGYGYQSFWGTGTASPASKLPEGFVQRTPHAHNGYLDILLQGGMVALALFAFLQVKVSLWIDRLTDVDPGLGFATSAIFLYMLLLNLLETDWLQGLSGSSMLVTLFILLAATQRNGRALT